MSNNVELHLIPKHMCWCCNQKQVIEGSCINCGASNSDYLPEGTPNLQEKRVQCANEMVGKLATKPPTISAILTGIKWHGKERDDRTDGSFYLFTEENGYNAFNLEVGTIEEAEHVALALNNHNKIVLGVFTGEDAKADSVIGEYFDETVTTADAAYDILVRHGVDPGYAGGLAADMYPNT